MEVDQANSPAFFNFKRREFWTNASLKVTHIRDSIATQYRFNPNPIIMPTAVITGAGSGIGHSFAQILLREV